MRRSCPRYTTVFLLLAPLALLACNVLDGDEWGHRREALERARARWETIGAESYSFSYRESCFCANAGKGPVAITVEGGVVTAGTYVDSNEVVDPNGLAALPTVDDLFDRIEEAIERRAHSYHVDYHPQLGYPAAMVFDYDFRMADDEVTVSVTDLQFPS